MSTHEKLNKMAAQARRDGYIALGVDGPVPLDILIQFAETVFPGHPLHELAIIQAEDDQIVIALALGRQTLPS